MTNGRAEMKFGMVGAFGSPFATPDFLEAVAIETEARGFESMWFGEHVVSFDEYTSRYPYSRDGRHGDFPGDGLLDPLTTIAYLAGCTSTLRFGTGILVLPQRNP